MILSTVCKCFSVVVASAYCSAVVATLFVRCALALDHVDASMESLEEAVSVGAYCHAL